MADREVLVARGYDRTVTFDGAEVLITSKHGVRDLRIEATTIRSVELKPATFWWNGFMRFVISGSEEHSQDAHWLHGRLVPAGRRAALHDRFAIMFKRRREGEFAVLRDALDRTIAQQRQARDESHS